MTNKTLIKKIATFESGVDKKEKEKEKDDKFNPEGLIFLGIAFNPSYSGNLLHHEVNRKHLKMTVGNFF